MVKGLELCLKVKSYSHTTYLQPGYVAETDKCDRGVTEYFGRHEKIVIFYPEVRIS